MRILFIGDIVGKYGLNYLKAKLPELKSLYKPNLVIVNAENTTNGKGLNHRDYKEFMSLNIACLTMGNHTYRNSEINDFIEGSKIARPMNILNQKGLGYVDINYNGKIITVINLLGTIHMDTNYELENPYKVVTEFLKNHKSDYTIVDMHAEATSEKLAMGFMLDGKVNAVVGTHTHVQTSDARILPNGTLYISDLGMTGPLNGILGVKKEIIIDRLTNDGKEVFTLDESNICQLNGVLLTLEPKAKIELIHLEK
jgi:metallophosphoesterase (TIGR00282 family)